MKSSLNIFAFLIITTACPFDAVKAAKFLEQKPDFLNPCHLSDANFKNCFSQNIQGIFHEWKDGIPNYKGLRGIDPLHIKRIAISQNSSNVLSFDSELTDVVLIGASKFIVKEANFNPKTLITSVTLFLEKFHIDCDYKINGRILNLVLNTKGKAIFEIGDSTMNFEIKVKLRDNGGHTFTDIEKLKLNIANVGNFHVYLDNLFNGQKELEESTNIIINENWRDFYDVLRPAISQAIEVVISDSMSKVFFYVPANYFIKNIPTAADNNA